jgi:hypothetical protein
VNAEKVVSLEEDSEVLELHPLLAKEVEKAGQLGLAAAENVHVHQRHGWLMKKVCQDDEKVSSSNDQTCSQNFGVTFQ